MDSRGWIPIPLIASFNRVKQLTRDEALVRDVLTLSSLVQVWGGMVRMGGWERYVLPDASPSIVEEPPHPGTYMGPPVDGGYLVQPHQPLAPVSPSVYEQGPGTELADSNGLQLHLGTGTPSQDDAHPSEETQVATTQNGLLAHQDEKFFQPMINGNGNGHTNAGPYEIDEDEDEEDDVVFVMGHEEGTWSSPDRKP